MVRAGFLNLTGGGRVEGGREAVNGKDEKAIIGSHQVFPRLIAVFCNPIVSPFELPKGPLIC